LSVAWHTGRTQISVDRAASARKREAGGSAHADQANQHPLKSQ
jgi:hypothetical protein